MISYQKKPHKEEMRSIHRETTWLWLIIIMAALVRLYRLDAQSLWLDEGWQYFIASANSLSGVYERVLRPYPAHPPLSYFINHLFLQVENSDFLLRLPSVLFGIGSVPLCYLLARRLASPSAAVCAVLVFALSPFHIWYSQEARMYAQLIFLSLLSTVFLLNALERPHKAWWVLYTLAVTAGLYTHIFMALGVIAQGLWIVLYQRHQVRSYSLSVATAVMFFGVPLRHFLLASYTASSRPTEATGFTWGALPYTLFTYAVGFSLGPSIQDLHEDRSLSFMVQFLPSILTVGTVFGILLMSGVWFSYKRSDTKYSSLCLCSFCLPLLGIVLFSLGPRFSFNVRYTAVAFPYFCIFTGIALSAFLQRNSLIGVAFLTALVGISSLSLYNYFSNPQYAKEDIRSAVKFFQENTKDEKVMIYNDGHAFYRYLTEEDVASERYRHISTDAVDDIRNFFSVYNTSYVYLFLSRDWNQVVEKQIDQAFSACKEKEFTGVKVFKISLE